MTLSRPLIAIACAAILLALPAAAGAQGESFAASHVIKTPAGAQLAVPVTVRYRLDGKGKSLERSRLATRLAVAARLPGGRVLRAAESQALPGQARVKVEHRAFFSVRATRSLRRALASRQRVRLAVASSLRADLDGDGKTDARTSQKATRTLKRPTRARGMAPGNGSIGDEPCGVLGLSPATCLNVTGPAWRATHLWDTETLRVVCPTAFPVATDTVRYRSRSRRFATWVLTRGRTARIGLVDGNTRGHPVGYEPAVACRTASRR